MSIEELKLILETLQHTTDGAKDFGIWWVVFHYGSKIIDMGLWVLCVWGVAWGIVKAIVLVISSSDSERNLRQLRDTMNIGTRGPVTPDEFDRMRDKIRYFMKEV